jgi:3-methyladenine DNA glycosylase AlkD
MNAQDLIYRDFVAFCQANANPVMVEKYRGYFKEGYDAWGVPREVFEAKVNELAGSPGMDLALALRLSEVLVISTKYEEVSLAIALVLKLHKTWDEATFRAVESWFDAGITNWAHTDYICGEIMPLFFTKGIITMDSLSDWRFSDRRFKRRASVVSLIKPMKKSADFAPFLRFIDPMMTDPERVVHQGLGWFLREMWKKQPEPVEAFLLRWKDRCARLIIQYATEKMTKEDRLRFRKNRQ